VKLRIRVRAARNRHRAENGWSSVAVPRMYGSAKGQQKAKSVPKRGWLVKGRAVLLTVNAFGGVSEPGETAHVTTLGTQT
jgi:hypothetical protein